MMVPSATASPWPARLAYCAAGIFISASGGTNLTYGWAKGSDLVTSTIWAAVAGGVAIVFALSWPALIRSVEARRWSAALMALAALLLAGGYSVTAALGSAAGGRANAATAETATTDARVKAQAAYDLAKAELDALKSSRPIGELEALVTAAASRTSGRGCTVQVSSGVRQTACTVPAALTAELGRAKRRSELEAKIDEASSRLAKTEPAKMANSDAKALSRYLAAAGIDVGADQLNDLLVLLAVLMIEAGGGLSLAVGMALNAPAIARTAPAADVAIGQAGRPEHAPVAAPDALNGHAGHRRTTPDTTAVQPVVHPRPMSGVQASGLVAWLRQQGGRADTSMRRLADTLGRSPSGVHEEVRRLVASGVISAACGRRGTIVTLL